MGGAFSNWKFGQSYNAKLKLIYPVAFTGWPSRTNGLKCHLRIASFAADCSRPGPVTLPISATFPCSSTVTATVTRPPALMLLAAGGYTGACCFVAYGSKSPITIGPFEASLFAGALTLLLAGGFVTGLFSPAGAGFAGLSVDLLASCDGTGFCGPACVTG